MAVRLRLKRLGRKHRPFYRICAMDSRSPRDGRVIEELGTYDPMITETDARAQLNGERISHWLSVGALPTPKVGVLIKKYGPEGTHLDEQKSALERMQAARTAPVTVEAPAKKKPAKPKAEEAKAGEAAPEVEEPKAEEAAAEETKPEEASGEGES